jgi:type II secretory pathway pseudopilin PulG
MSETQATTNTNHASSFVDSKKQHTKEGIPETETNDLEASTAKQSSSSFKKFLLSVLGFVLVGFCSGAFYVLVLDRTGSTKDMLMKVLGAQNQVLKRSNSRVPDKNDFISIKSVPGVPEGKFHTVQSDLLSINMKPVIILSVVILLILAGVFVGGYFLYQKTVEDQRFAKLGVDHFNGELKSKQGEIDQLNQEIDNSKQDLANSDSLSLWIVPLVSSIVNGAIFSYHAKKKSSQIRETSTHKNDNPIVKVFIGLNVLFGIASVVCCFLRGQFLPIVFYIGSVVVLIIIALLSLKLMTKLSADTKHAQKVNDEDEL